MILQSFSFTATSNGQTVFGPIVPSDTPSAVCAIDGVLQDAVTGPDYMVSGGYYVTLAQGVTIGTVVHGSICL